MRGLIAVVALVVGLATSSQTMASAALDGACPVTLPATDFPDVPETSVHRQAIECIAWWEITAGTGFGTYDPSGVVRRDQMASFVARLVERLDGELPRYASNTYDDVSFDNPHRDSIARLSEVGLVQGSGAASYSPSSPVTRAQMATFLVRAYEYANDRALPAGPDTFGDDNGSSHESNINKAAAAGFAAGVAPGSYNPSGPVTRDQMATFMARVLDRAIIAGEALLPVENVELAGDGDDLSEPFRVRSGTYELAYDFGDDCFYGVFFDAEVDGYLGLVGPSGMGPRGGAQTILHVEAITYRLDMITGPPPGCPWEVTLVRAP